MPVSKFLGYVAGGFLNEIIGVHCTHGLNRTGYLICRYLVQQLGWKANDAVKAFQGARGHPIERQEYVKHMKSSSTTKINTSSINLRPQSSPSGKKSKSGRARATESHPPTGSGLRPRTPSPRRIRESWGRVPARAPPPGWGLPPPFVGLPPSRMGLPPPAQGLPPPFVGLPPSRMDLPPPAQGLPPPPGPGFPGPRPNGYGIRPPHYPRFSVHTGGSRRPVFPASRPPENEPRSTTQQPFESGFVNLNNYNSRTRRMDRRPVPNGAVNRVTYENKFCHSNGPLRRAQQLRPSRFTY